MKLRGIVFKFGDDINTDSIIAGRYKFSIVDMKLLSRHIFEDIRPHFYKELKNRHSIIVAGNNFGMGSSREQAPWVIKEVGILCIVAKSFARIFYRNSFNIGLPLIEADTSQIAEGDTLQIDFDKGIIKDTTKNKIISFLPFDNFRKSLLKCGGIINYLRKYKDFKLSSV